MHRSHDYAHLIRRWRAVARRSGVRLIPFFQAGEHTLFCLQTRASTGDGGAYISAGIHGDEPGSTEGLISWAEHRLDELPDLPVVLFPCLNPWGLARNLRTNADGIDLNRAFDRDDIPMIAALKKTLHKRRFSASLSLHEDYDAQGIYLYEVKRERPFWGESLLAAASSIIPIDPRSRIDLGRPKNGVMRRTYNAKKQARLGGMPESIYLDKFHSQRSVTFETPSEFHLDQRTAAHHAVVDACLRKVMQTSERRRS